MARFRTRARAVDMLGRQQIAGIPTAISELFKNAHDAYANRVEVDYYRSDRLFVLRDDGVGMTREDFEGRWLTIGTESKVGGRAGLELPATPQGQTPRPILGEKGIGRLAIAAIGPQVLILTRAIRDGISGELVAAYVHWRLFELPGIDLDQIEIPVRSFPPGCLPTRNDVAEMVEVFSNNIEKLGTIIGEATAGEFRRDFESMRLNPSEIDAYVSEMSLAEAGHGTHFIISPAYEILEADLDEGDRDRASNLEKFLLGFTNTMTPDHPTPVIRTAFRDHKTEDSFDDLVDEEKFFTPAEFQTADHHITGRFDEYGQFVGTVMVYGETYTNHIVPWPRAQGRRTYCGPFQIHLANVQGAARESTIPIEEYAPLINKMNRFGGLYIYRDGIRILPYGDTEYDWLEIEKRRTAKASYYHFSYRRIFGVIELTRNRNADLHEKAGREGFLENRAYRQFRDILKHFFVQIAADFFRQEGVFADRYEEKKVELERLELARRRREGQVSEKRRQFSRALEEFHTDFEAGRPQQEAAALTKELRDALGEAVAITDPSIAARKLLEIEGVARKRARSLEEKYRLIKPRGIGLGQNLQQDYDDYLTAYAELADVFREVRNVVEEEVGAAAEMARVELDRRVRVERALQELSDQTRRAARAERTETGGALETVRARVQEAARESIATIEGTIKAVLAEFAVLDVSSLSEEEITDIRDNLERRILMVKDHEQSFLRGVRTQLEAIDLSAVGDQLDQMEALEERNLALEERADNDLQLSQLGMAIEVINHEFDSSIRAIRGDLRRLKTWADENRGLEPLYRDLRSSFEHLDGYLTLFTPLHRRLYRQEVEIFGSDIHAYIGDLFQKRFQRHHISLTATDEFMKMHILGYPSSFYPAFVNLVDNAIFWMKDQEERTIQLSAVANTMFVSNTGPSIPERRWERVFEQGVSFKPGGRGLGLYIAREALRRVGYELSLVPPVSGMNVTFQIARISIAEAEEE
jgi:hypothetical protein